MPVRSQWRILAFIGRGCKNFTESIFESSSLRYATCQCFFINTEQNRTTILFEVDYGV